MMVVELVHLPLFSQALFQCAASPRSVCYLQQEAGLAELVLAGLQMLLLQNKCVASPKNVWYFHRQAALAELVSTVL
jgi:hypothetical protein